MVDCQIRHSLCLCVKTNTATEIRLLNDLLECQSNWLRRKQVLNRAAVPDVLRSDYFFWLVDRMLDGAPMHIEIVIPLPDSLPIWHVLHFLAQTTHHTDVQQQGPAQQQVAEWLVEIKKECTARLEAASTSTE